MMVNISRTFTYLCSKISTLVELDINIAVFNVTPIRYHHVLHLLNAVPPMNQPHTHTMRRTLFNIGSAAHALIFALILESVCALVPRAGPVSMVVRNEFAFTKIGSDLDFPVLPGTSVLIEIQLLSSKVISGELCACSACGQFSSHALFSRPSITENCITIFFPSPNVSVNFSIPSASEGSFAIHATWQAHDGTHVADLIRLVVCSARSGRTNNTCAPLLHRRNEMGASPAISSYGECFWNNIYNS
jgi:hypothetical protein